MNALSIQNLIKKYNNDFEALKGINLDIKQGDFFALLGPNGAGKSTLINILISLVYKTSGKISIMGVDIDENFSKAKTYVGVVPQEFNFGIFEKIEDILINQAGYYGIPLKVAKERAEKYLRQLGLWEKRHQKAMRLSGGMKRRLMIARALVHEPEVLILDEPTAGVDIELRRSMWDFLVDLNKNKGITIILTTHYLEEAEQLCKNVAIINEGEIIENSSVKGLLRKLKVQKMVFDLSNPIDKTPALEGFNCTMIDNTTLEIDIEKGKSLNTVMEQLDKKGIEVEGIANKQNRLEELFLSMTKKKGGQ